MMGRGDGPGAGAAGGPTRHVPVLLAEVCDALDVKRGGIFIDGTFGAGGYTRAVLDAHPQNKVIAIDRDPEAIAGGANLSTKFKKRLLLVPGRFGDLDELAREQGFESVDGVVLDIGVSSMQLDQAERGFSFRNDGPLDMRMDPTRGESAAEWLATASIEQMTEVFRDYGEERFAFQVAKAIAARRQERGPLATTAELAQLVAGAVKTREPGQDPATRTFQALRIFINAELEELQQALEASLSVLQPQGRLAVISFHSLEDRIVKQFIATHSREVYDRRAPFAAPKAMKLKALGRVKPSQAEVDVNPRARSAILRVAERTAT
jgi:16S rRNA (cytosine1402-N4)-methyltransferase